MSLEISEPAMIHAESSAALSVENVSFAYPHGPRVLDQVSAVLRPGRLCVLIGPNAAGKTTLLRLMLGQLDALSGQVRLGGEAVHTLGRRHRATRISYVPQRAGVNFAFTVEQVVSLGRFALPNRPAVIQNALTTCGLADLAQRSYADLSVGQQQRVLLARALAQSHDHGRVMLLDEPVSAMDLWHMHQTMRTLSDLARRGLAVLVILHDLNLAMHYAQDVWLMDAGRMVASGSADQVLVPARLEPIYRVGLTRLDPPDGRPGVFAVDPQATL